MSIVSVRIHGLQPTEDASTAIQMTLERGTMEFLFREWSQYSLIRGRSERPVPMPERPGPFHERPGPFPGRPGPSSDRSRVFTGRIRPFPERRRPFGNRRQLFSDSFLPFSVRYAQFHERRDPFLRLEIFTERMEQFLGRSMPFLEVQDIYGQRYENYLERNHSPTDNQDSFPQRHDSSLIMYAMHSLRQQQVHEGTHQRPQITTEISQSNLGLEQLPQTAWTLSNRLEPLLFRPRPFSELFRSRRAMI